MHNFYNSYFTLQVSPGEVGWNVSAPGSLPMVLHSNLRTTLIAPALWTLAVISICLFAHHSMAIFATDGLQSAGVEVGKPG
jgi:hypothetical protein